MKQMTEKNLKDAFAGESQASIRYHVYADRAEKEYPNVARLFRALAFAERAHATNHLRALGGVKTTADNLDTAAAGESFEINEMYPAYLAVAELQEEKQAQRSMHNAFEAERVHLSLYERAKEAVNAGHDFAGAAIHICSVCGWTVEGDAPDKCPICGTKKERFQPF
ncbi:MAG: rubrerythrin family protein [Chloroflexota bacterium]